MRKGIFTSAALTFAVVGAISAAACTSSSNSPPPSSDAGTQGTKDGSSAIDGNVSIDAAQVDGSTQEDTGTPVDGNSPAIDSGEDAGALTATEVPLAAVPQRFVYNETTSILYVLGSNGGGVIPIDTANGNAVGTALVAPTDAGPTGYFDVIAVDSTSNLVFATSYRSIYVWNGATGTFSTTIDLSSITLSSNSARIYGLAADGAAHKLYALLGYISGSQVVAVIDTSTSTPSLTTTVSLSDIIQFGDAYGDALVVDPTNHLLFVCGLTSTGAPAADAIDTTTNEVHGTQQSFTGNSIDCAASNGFAALATTTQLHALEPASVNLPTGFTANSFSVTTAEGFTTVVVFGQENGNTVAYRLGFCGETSEGEPSGPIPISAFNQRKIASSKVISGANGQSIWFDSYPVSASSDGGPATTTAYVVHVPALPAPDGGCE